MGQPVAMLVPEGRRDEMRSILDRIRCGGSVEPFETQRRHRDGSTVDVLLRVSPVRDGSGRIIGACKIARDISDRRAAERQRRHLKVELNHRVKTTLMTVQSIASQTLRSSSEPSAFWRAFETRLSALSRAHDLLAACQWEAVELRDLIAHNLAPFAEKARFRMMGPVVRLGPEATVSLGLAFNELTLNALTAGALLDGDGDLSVTWETADAGDGRGLRLRLDWVESHGRMLGAPTRKGFGRRFLEDKLGRQFNGSVMLAFEPKGVHCHLDLRLDALRASAFDR